jgi:hypothetical protein
VAACYLVLLLIVLLFRIQQLLLLLLLLLLLPCFGSGEGLGPFAKEGNMLLLLLVHLHAHVGTIIRTPSRSTQLPARCPGDCLTTGLSQGVRQQGCYKVSASTNTFVL